MDKNTALQLIWDYMHMGHELKKADAILVLGNRDIRVAQYAADLYLAGWAPWLLFSGSGIQETHKPGRERFINSTEAEVFAKIAIDKGVPAEAIIIEDKAENTGQNYEYSLRLLKEKGIEPKTLIIVQKPYMERRAYATGKVWLPSLELISTSPDISLADYPNEDNSHDEHWIHTMVGDLQRIKEYPAKGFQVKQEIPKEVWEAYEYLVEAGYTNRLIDPN